MAARSALLAVLLLLAAAPAGAFDETIDVPSRDVSDEALLRGTDADAAPITLTGRLSGPDRDAPVPVVILLHGSDGPRSGAAGSWRAYLNDSGVATLRLDSYSPRGLRQVGDDLGAFGQFAQVYDLYRAADALAADPRIDASRIVAMGFSRGGTGALYAAMSRFHHAFGPRRAKIVAYLPFYPACNFELVDETRVAAAPIRLFHGARDDATLASSCRVTIDRWKAAGADAEMTEYADARHAFDNVGLPSYFSDAAVQTSRDCLRREVDGRLVNAATGEPFSYRDACVAYGPGAQYDDAATVAARAAVTALLAEVWR